MNKVSVTVSLGMLVLAVNMFASAALAEDPYVPAWFRNFGIYATSASEKATDLTLDHAGNIIVTGEFYDPFIAKYGPSGNMIWTEQFEADHTEPTSVTTDSLGNIYIGGWTMTELFEPLVNSSYSDAFVAKYDTNGNLSWGKQLGSGRTDQIWSVAADSSDNLFVAGYTGSNLISDTSWGAFLMKFDSAGNELWRKALGTPGTGNSGYANAVAVDQSGYAYVVGKTKRGIDGAPLIDEYDGFLVKYSPTGDPVWTRQIGTDEFEEIKSVTVDDLGNAYICGTTKGDLYEPSMGDADVFIAKYDTAGDLLWSDQIGSSNQDYAYSIAIDGTGNAIFTGKANDSPRNGDINIDGTAGASDRKSYAFITKYDTTGNQLWVELSNGIYGNQYYSLAIDSSGDAIITGQASQDYLGNFLESFEPFLYKMMAPPCSLENPGDFNCDNSIDLVDLVIMGEHWGESGYDPIDIYPLGDMNGDGTINLLDLVTFGENYNTPVTPEPASLTLTGILGCVLLKRRK